MLILAVLGSFLPVSTRAEAGASVRHVSETHQAAFYKAPSLHPAPGFSVWIFSHLRVSPLHVTHYPSSILQFPATNLSDHPGCKHYFQIQKKQVKRVNCGVSDSGTLASNKTHRELCDNTDKPSYEASMKKQVPQASTDIHCWKRRS